VGELSFSFFSFFFYFYFYFLFFWATQAGNQWEIRTA